MENIQERNMINEPSSAAMKNVLDGALDAQGELITLSPRNEQHRRFILDVFGEDAPTANFPAMRTWLDRSGETQIKTLKEFKGATPDWVDSVAVSGFGFCEKKFLASGVVSLVHKPVFLQSALVFIQRSTGQVLSVCALPKVFGVGYQRLRYSVDETPENGDIAALMVAVWLPEDSDSLVMKAHAVTAPRQEPADYVAQVTVEEPKQLPRHKDVDHILIALYRTPEAPDTDYDYLYDFGITGGAPNWAIPMKGWAKLSNNVRFGSGSVPAPSITFTKRAGGGSKVFTPVAMDFDKDESTGVLRWNVHSNLGEGFPWGQHVECEYEFTASFPVMVDGVADTSFVRVSSFQSVPGVAKSNEGITKYLKYAWGCLAPDTLVTMEDGSERAISKLLIGDRILGGSGKVRYIENIWRGMEIRPLVCIEIQGGHTLSMTEQHPVFLQDGKAVRAGELKAGDTVTTREGPKEITAITRTPLDKDVWNLDVAGESSFFAGGVLVGDNRLQNSI